MRAYAEHVENHDRHADRDRRIGDVERPEVVRPPVDVDEIDDRPDDDAVDQVAGRAADDERQADRAAAADARARPAEYMPTPTSAAVAISGDQRPS